MSTESTGSLDYVTSVNTKVYSTLFIYTNFKLWPNI